MRTRIQHDDSVWERRPRRSNDRVISEEKFQQFREHLYREEKSAATVEKYLRDVRAFWSFAGKRAVDKELVIAFKKELVQKGYAVRSVNSMLASVNSFLEFCGWQDCRAKHLRHQRQIYSAENKELTKEEYLRLLKAAEKQPQLCLVMKTICGTGIRVSELKHFTVEAVKTGEVVINCKNKTRTILIPGKLKKLLLTYAKRNQIRHGPIFITKRGHPLDRSSIWKKMKQLCEEAGVLASKVFPHNLRKLFARTYYKIEKDIAKLADILGHSSINTTRIYIMTTGLEHRRQIEKLGLVV